MINIKINNNEFLVNANFSILEACKNLGFNIPRFCYHESLSVAGNCRMCLVEIEKAIKPIISCATLVISNMQIYLSTPLIQKARENILESLLINHPLDCPICDQGGECDLQDQVNRFGINYSRFFFKKRGVEDKNCGPLIKTIMTRCIHCTRCIRFGNEIANIDFLGSLNRGNKNEIGNYINKILVSEISGTVIDLCPVGALTSKTYAFISRPWELYSQENLDLTDSVGSNIYINFKETNIQRILPKNNIYLNDNIISDRIRFSYDALKSQRLLSGFQLNCTQKLSKINWNNIIFLLEKKLDEKTLILINNEIDFLVLKNLFCISNKFFKVKLRTVSTSISEKNYNVRSNNKIFEISNSISKVCFLISTNLCLESVILNIKLRISQKKKKMQIFCFGQNNTFINNKTLFIHLNNEILLLIFEGKKRSFSEILMRSYKPLIFIGMQTNLRLQNFEFIYLHIKNISYSAIFFFIVKACNSTGLLFLGLKTVTSRELYKINNIFAINLDDTVFLRKFLVLNKIFFWFNSYGSEIALKLNFLIPILAIYEEEGVYLNLEGKPQKSLKSINNISKARSLLNIVTFLSKKFKKTYTFDFFLTEIILKPNLFNKKKIFFSFNFKYLNSFCSLYPIKNFIEDPFLINLFTKQSNTLSRCSYEFRKEAHNFI